MIRKRLIVFTKTEQLLVKILSVIDRFTGTPIFGDVPTGEREHMGINNRHNFPGRFVVEELSEPMSGDKSRNLGVVIKTHFANSVRGGSIFFADIVQGSQPARQLFAERMLDKMGCNQLDVFRQSFLMILGSLSPDRTDNFPKTARDFLFLDERKRELFFLVVKNPVAINIAKQGVFAYQEVVNVASAVRGLFANAFKSLELILGHAPFGKEIKIPLPSLS